MGRRNVVTMEFVAVVAGVVVCSGLVCGWGGFGLLTGSGEGEGRRQW